MSLARVAADSLVPAVAQLPGFLMLIVLSVLSVLLNISGIELLDIDLQTPGAPVYHPGLPSRHRAGFLSSVKPQAPGAACRPATRAPAFMALSPAVASVLAAVVPHFDTLDEAVERCENDLLQSTGNSRATG